MNIITPRLVIRRVTAEDWRAVQAIWLDQQLSPYAGFDRPNDVSGSAVEPRIAKWASFAESFAHIFCAVCLGGEMIGYIAMNATPNGYETGYCFRSHVQGRGYARESLAAVIDFIRQNTTAKVITAGTALENIPSVRLLEYLGFELTGTERVSFYKNADGSDIVFEGGIYEKKL